MITSVDLDMLRCALAWAAFSRDPNTQVGAVLSLGADVLATSYNHFPKGIAYTPDRLTDRELKNRLMVHAERGAIITAGLRGLSMSGGTIYLAARDHTGMIWGGCPCTACTVELIDAGVARVVSYRRKGFSKWAADIDFAMTLLAEAGVVYEEVYKEPPGLFSGGDPVVGRGPFW